MSAAVLPADPFAIPQCGYGILAAAFALPVLPSAKRQFHLGLLVIEALHGTVGGLRLSRSADGSMVCRRFPREVR